MISLRSKNTKAILGYMFLHEDAELYVNEMARKFSLDDGNLSRKLKELEREGILKCRERGHECYYSLNGSYPLLKEYKGIVLKTIGFEQKLRDALQKIPAIEEAFLFGSYAGGTMDAASDIDLLVVGGHGTLALQKAVAALQKEMDREINVISMSPREYQDKIKRDPFLKSLAKKEEDTGHRMMPEKDFFQKLKFSDHEIRSRFENARRDLEIAAKDPFPEVRFSYAFQALVKTGIALFAREGLKVRSIPGHHVKILERMSEILKDPDILTLGNAMRMKRNQDLYGAGERVSEKESREYLEFVQKILKKEV